VGEIVNSTQLDSAWLDSKNNQLIINPRLSDVLRARYSEAFTDVVEKHMHSHVGVVTSGSSGTYGKLILLSKAALEVSAAAVNKRLDSVASDIWMKTLPDFHVGGLGICVRAALSGSKVLESAVTKWNASEFYHELDDSGATLLSLVPTQLFDLVRLNFRAPPKLRAVIVGGGALSDELRDAALGLNWPCLPSYGLTECCSQVATAVSRHVPALRPLEHVELRTSVDGWLQIKSASLLSARIVFSDEGYELEDPKVKDWLETEDRAIIESDGTLKMFGRAADFIKVGGEGVVVSRLEALLDRIKLDTKIEFDLALLAAADERLGAVIVLLSDARDASRAKLQALVKDFNDQVMPFERIKEVKRVGKIPRSPLGKLLRSEALHLVGLKPFANS
jgi:O-succinylbenzoic acid--CoA ligase